MSITSANEICCPKFEPTPWDEKEITWSAKRFVKERVRCFLYIPLNFGSVMKRTMEKIEAADAKPDEVVILADECSPWRSEVFVEATKDVPGAEMTTISGNFLSKVFEGPYKDTGKWRKAMNEFVASRGKEAKKTYSYYTTCPKCAKKYGKNYVVMVAQV